MFVFSPDCAKLNWEKRNQEADLKVIKVGYSATSGTCLFANGSASQNWILLWIAFVALWCYGYCNNKVSSRLCKTVRHRFCLAFWIRYEIQSLALSMQI